jgi:hypothetical protein
MLKRRATWLRDRLRTPGGSAPRAFSAPVVLLGLQMEPVSAVSGALQRRRIHCVSSVAAIPKRALSGLALVLLLLFNNSTIAQERSSPSRPLERVRSFWTGVGIPPESREGPCAIDRRQVEAAIIAQLRAAFLSVVSFDYVMRRNLESIEATERANAQLGRGGRLPDTFDDELARRRANHEELSAMATFNTLFSSMPLMSPSGEPGCALAIGIQVLANATTHPTLRATGRPTSAAHNIWFRQPRIVFVPAADWESGLRANLAENLDHFIHAWRTQNGETPSRTPNPAPTR